jgi:hypothetical protein
MVFPRGLFLPSSGVGVGADLERGSTAGCDAPEAPPDTVVPQAARDTARITAPRARIGFFIFKILSIVLSEAYCFLMEKTLHVRKTHVKEKIIPVRRRGLFL